MIMNEGYRSVHYGRQDRMFYAVLRSHRNHFWSHWVRVAFNFKEIDVIWVDPLGGEWTSGDIVREVDGHGE